jgi:hypothetical protein
MTRRPVALLVLTGIILAAASTPALAQYRGPDRAPVRFYADLGYVNLFDYPKWITLGPEVEFRLGRVVSFNPEVMIWIRETAGSNVDFVPAATLNFRLNRFVFGVGAALKVGDWGEAAAGSLVPKFQFGYMAGPTRLGLSLYYLNETRHVVVGMSFAMRLGGGPRREPDE